MGKKGGWFSAIKRVFTHNSKERPSNGADKKSTKEKQKKGKGLLSHGETKSSSFNIPLFREPSSIEKILGEADQLLIRPPPPLSSLYNEPETAVFRPPSPRVSSARIATSPPRAVSPTVAQHRMKTSYVHRPEHTLRNQHLSATKIQAAFRGYLARRNFRALRGLVRLQGVVRGQNVKRQTMNAMKQLQLLVRVQTQIQSRRIQMLESQAVLQGQPYIKNDKDLESTLSKWTINQLSELGNNDDWDDSVLMKEEVESRFRQKIEATIKRERAMAYAYSHQQLWRANSISAQSPLDTGSNGFPWWWNWLERQLPPAMTNSQSQAATKKATITPPRPISEYKSNYQAATPELSRSRIPSKTPPPANASVNSKPRKSTASATYDLPLRDDDSLTSCPPFSAVPNYMTPTVSTKAKVRANSNPKERLPLGTPGNDSKRRFSFSLTPNIGSFKWNKGSKKDLASHKTLEKHHPSHSIGDLSVDSTVSMPAIVGRKAFNRFV